MTDAHHGPVHPTPDAVATLRPLSLDEVGFAPDGFLGAWQHRNAASTLPHCVRMLDEAGAMDNLRRTAAGDSGGFRNMWFADSDVYKTLEAASWQLALTPEREDLRAFVDTTGALLAKAQDDDGYLNSHFTLVAPEKRWQELHWSHELYCAGHLVQAAVAATRAGVGAEAVAVARRFADLIVERFSAVDGTDGHPEIETALVELYRSTGHRPYLDLAGRLVDLRGRGLLPAERFGPGYLQDHVPVREAAEVTGHVVRQLYLLAGIVDVAVETHDLPLLDTAVRLWEDAFGTKMYVTGAHGSRHRDEAYGDPYELPPDRAYGETCAAIAGFHLSWRLLLATGEVRYADEMERALYNVIAGSTAIDGTHFFYSNPLHLRTGHDGSHEDAPSQRLSWYSCSCCPPNLARLVSSLHGYAVTTDDSGLQMHLYGDGVVRSTVDGVPVEITVVTQYPWDGRVTLVVEGGGEWTLALRVPGWCTEATTDVESTSDGGYLRVTRDWTRATEVVLTLAMPPRFVAPHPRIDAVRGCVVLARGPLVYCVEQTDLPDGVVLEDVRVDPFAPVAVGAAEGVPVTLRAAGAIERPGADELYPPVGAIVPLPAALTLTAVPYALWGNREAGPMRVWVPVSSARSGT
jgi:DUF1680 family protein